MPLIILFIYSQNNNLITSEYFWHLAINKMEKIHDYVINEILEFVCEDELLLIILTSKLFYNIYRIHNHNYKNHNQINTCVKKMCRTHNLVCYFFIQIKNFSIVDYCAFNNNLKSLQWLRSFNPPFLLSY